MTVSCGIAAVLALGLLAAWLVPEAFRRSVPPSTWPWFREYLVQLTVVTASGLVVLLAWLLIPVARRASRFGLGLLAFGELLATANGLNPQVDPATYYPESTLCRFLTDRVGDGRICGLFGVRSANLAMTYGLRDVRGYDAVDADPFVELVLAMRWPCRAAACDHLAAFARPFAALRPARRPRLHHANPPARVRRLRLDNWPAATFTPTPGPCRGLSLLGVPCSSDKADRLRRLGDPSFNPLRRGPHHRGDRPALGRDGWLGVDRVRVGRPGRNPGRVPDAVRRRPRRLRAEGWSVTVDG